MSEIRVNVCVLALSLLAGCGAPITGEWNGVAELEAMSERRALGLSVEKDEAFEVSGRLVDAQAPKRRHAVGGTRLGTVVFLGWEDRDGRAVDVTRFVGRTDGEVIEGYMVCERRTGADEAPTFCPAMPAGIVRLERGALVIEEDGGDGGEAEGPAVGGEG